MISPSEKRLSIALPRGIPRILTTSCASAGFALPVKTIRPSWLLIMHLLQAVGGEELREFLAGEEGLEPSNAGIKIRCLNQLGDSPTLTLSPDGCVGTSGDAKPYDAKPKSGCVSRLAVTALFHSVGSLDFTASASPILRNAANTLAPDPVIRAGAMLFVTLSNHRNTCATSAYFPTTTCCMSFRPYPSGHPALKFCCARKSVIVMCSESLVNDFSEKIAAVGTCTFGVTTRK